MNMRKFGELNRRNFQPIERALRTFTKCDRDVISAASI